MSKDNTTPTTEQQVNTLVSAMTQGEDGKWSIPEDVTKDVPEAVVFAAKAERRYRDTQGSYTKSQQQLKELETINTELTDHVVKNATLHLSIEERDELDDLKTSNPEAWRAKLNEHETKAKEIQQETIDGFKKKGRAVSAGEARQQAYQEFTSRTGITLSDQVIKTQLPASYAHDLAEGTLTFDDFLSKAEKFLTPGKVIKGAEGDTAATTDLSDLPGGSQPSESAKTKDDNLSYANEVY